MNNDSLEKRYLDLIEDGGNVSESSDVKEFFTVVAIVMALLFSVFFASDIIAKIYINNMSDEAQAKFEKIIAYTPYYKSDKKHERYIATCNKLKQNIIGLDKSIQGKSKFNIYIHPSTEINAFVTADGSIYLTEGLIKEVKDEEELTFILAHEMGHYAHRDHLKFVSRQVITALVLSAMNLGQSSHFSNFASSMNNISDIRYSQKQETDADIYANHAIISLYGSNRGGINFFKRIETKEHFPQFIHYISTHPSPKDRIKVLKTHN